MPEQEQVTGEGTQLTVEGSVRPGSRRETGSNECSAQLALSFFRSPGLKPTFREGLPMAIKLFKINPSEVCPETSLVPPGVPVVLLLGNSRPCGVDSQH